MDEEGEKIVNLASFKERLQSVSRNEVERGFSDVIMELFELHTRYTRQVHDHNLSLEVELVKRRELSDRMTTFCDLSKLWLGFSFNDEREMHDCRTEIISLLMNSVDHIELQSVISDIFEKLSDSRRSNLASCYEKMEELFRSNEVGSKL